MNTALQALVAASGGFLAASAGFWTYLVRRMRHRDMVRDANSHLLMGLAQNKIITLGMEYIERGWVTTDEFGNLKRYLWEPYCELGGNGAAERIMYAVQRLPFRSTNSIQEEAFQKIPIRESDSTGYRKDGCDYEGEERRGKEDK